jgi:uncharacterized protein YdeI (YjbR/CyaY-like superfamily)
LKTFNARNCDQWRAWLAKHHTTESEVWLVFYKPHTGRASVAYMDALDEALCFGWIDSLIKRLDDDRYARKFTPRKPDSRWSEINRKRFAELKATGRVMPAGLERPPTDRSYGAPPATSAKVPPYIQKALNEQSAARKYFESLVPSHRRNYLMWIDSAKREETKARRLAEAIRMLAAGKKLGLK